MLRDKGMNWKPFAARLKLAVTQPDRALLIELASWAVLLAWMAHRAIE